MTLFREPPTATPRQDRRPKLYCQGCKKSRRMAFVPGGYRCVEGHFRPLPPRRYAALER